MLRVSDRVRTCAERLTPQSIIHPRIADRPPHEIHRSLHRSGRDGAAAEGRRPWGLEFSNARNKPWGPRGPSKRGGWRTRTR
jgi:hypothetical protein